MELKKRERDQQPGVSGVCCACGSARSSMQVNARSDQVETAKNQPTLSAGTAMPSNADGRSIHIEKLLSEGTTFFRLFVFHLDFFFPYR